MLFQRGNYLKIIKIYQDFSLIVSIAYFIGLCVLVFPSSVYAQEEGEEFPEEAPQEQAAATGGGVTVADVLGIGEGGWRIGFMEWSAVRYDYPHPFKQLTGYNVFNNPSPRMLTPIDHFLHEGEEMIPEFDTALDRALFVVPPFSVERLLPSDFLISGISLMFYHTSYYEDDELILGNKAEEDLSQIPIVRMKTHFELFTISVHPFTDPSEEGVDFYLGIGSGIVHGAYEGGFRARAENDYVRTTEIKSYQGPAGVLRRMGIDINGETFGFRFAIIVLDRKAVVMKGDDNIFYGNPLTPDALEEISFTGVILRIGLTAKL